MKEITWSYRQTFAQSQSQKPINYELTLIEMKLRFQNELGGRSECLWRAARRNNDDSQRRRDGWSRLMQINFTLKWLSSRFKVVCALCEVSRGQYAMTGEIPNHSTMLLIVFFFTICFFQIPFVNIENACIIYNITFRMDFLVREYSY